MKSENQRPSEQTDISDTIQNSEFGKAKQTHGGHDRFGLDVVLFSSAQRERMGVNMLVNR
jgi:hypothetical protein